MTASLGYLCVLATGVLWCGVGIAVSLAAKHKIPGGAFLGFSMVGSALISWIVLPDYNAIQHVPWQFWALFVSAGAISSSGSLALTAAMRRGNHGVSWALGQSAMVMPFVFSVLWFSQKANLIGWLGLAATLSGILVIGIYGKRGKSKAITDTNFSTAALALALVSFTLLGVSQIMTLLPNHVELFRDIANVRIPAGLSGGAMAMLLVDVKVIVREAKLTWLKYSLFLTGMALPGQFFLYQSMDRLEPHALTNIVYPVAIALSTVLFCGYSVLVLKERYSRPMVIGVVCCIVGVVFLSI